MTTTEPSPLTRISIPGPGWDHTWPAAKTAAAEVEQTRLDQRRADMCRTVPVIIAALPALHPLAALVALNLALNGGRDVTVAEAQERMPYLTLGQVKFALAELASIDLVEREIDPRTKATLFYLMGLEA